MYFTSIKSLDKENESDKKTLVIMSNIFVTKYTSMLEHLIAVVRDPGNYTMKKKIKSIYEKSREKIQCPATFNFEHLIKMPTRNPPYDEEVLERWKNQFEKLEKKGAAKQEINAYNEEKKKATLDIIKQSLDSSYKSDVLDNTKMDIDDADGKTDGATKAQSADNEQSENQNANQDNDNLTDKQKEEINDGFNNIDNNNIKLDIDWKSSDEEIKKAASDIYEQTNETIKAIPMLSFSLNRNVYTNMPVYSGIVKQKDEFIRKNDIASHKDKALVFGTELLELIKADSALGDKIAEKIKQIFIDENLEYFVQGEDKKEKETEQEEVNGEEKEGGEEDKEDGEEKQEEKQEEKENDKPMSRVDNLNAEAEADDTDEQTGGKKYKTSKTYKRKNNKKNKTIKIKCL